MLIICDSQSLATTKPSFAEDLARRLPGCLVWDGKGNSGGLIMVRRSDAICALPGNRGFVCNGAGARHSKGSNANRDSEYRVPLCSAETLSRFGFT